VVAIVALALLSTGCDPIGLKKLDTFGSIKYEPPARGAFMIKRSITEWLYSQREADARAAILRYAPSYDWSPWCAIAPGACIGASWLTGRFASDVRTRGDFREALVDAHNRGGCFTWSVTATGSTNFTNRGAGDDHCNA
jgi:hypothetical protein